MRVVSWNVNSIRARLPRVLAFLRRHEPDVVCLQETKVSNDDFPTMEVESAGYRTIVHGQQSYNGVAILVDDPTRRSNLRSFGTNPILDQGINGKPNLYKPRDVKRGFPDDPVPEEARVLSACLGGLRLVNVYVVNGAPIDSDRFEIKRRWMTALGDWQQSLSAEPPLLIVGDFNVAPDDRDVWDPDGLQGRVHCTDEERAWLRNLQGNRLQDLLRASGDHTDVYTWWPYQDRAFERNEGLRFDLALGDEEVAEKVKRVWVDRDERRPSFGDGTPSDHAPLIIDLEDAISYLGDTVFQQTKITNWES